MNLETGIFMDKTQRLHLQGEAKKGNYFGTHLGLPECRNFIMLDI